MRKIRSVAGDILQGIGLFTIIIGASAVDATPFELVLKVFGAGLVLVIAGYMVRGGQYNGR